MRILFLLGITIFSAGNIFGQIFSSSVPNDGKYKKENKTLTVYDPQTNLTTVQSPFLLLYKTEGSMGHLGEFLTGSVSFSYQGKTQFSTPDLYELKIISHGNNSWRFIRTEARDLQISVDDELIGKLALDRVSSRRFNDVNAMRSRFEEVLTGTISSLDLAKAVNAKKVKLQLGKDYKITFLKDQLKILRDFLLAAKR